MQWPDERAATTLATPSRPTAPTRNAQTPLRSYRSRLSARSSVVNGSLRGPKERRSFKPKVASSNLVGRIVLKPFSRAGSGSASGVAAPSSFKFREVNGGRPKTVKACFRPLSFPWPSLEEGRSLRMFRRSPAPFSFRHSAHLDGVGLWRLPRGRSQTVRTPRKWRSRTFEARRHPSGVHKGSGSLPYLEVYGCLQCATQPCRGTPEDELLRGFSCTAVPAPPCPTAKARGRLLHCRVAGRRSNT
jgi:hypothetical protein